MFKAHTNVSNIREVNLEDINGTIVVNSSNASTATRQIAVSQDKRPGLFRLDQYTKDISKHGSSIYWLASPGYNNANGLYTVENDGIIRGTSIIALGVRPIIKLSNVTITRVAGSHVWKIVDTLE